MFFTLEPYSVRSYPTHFHLLAYPSLFRFLSTTPHLVNLWLIRYQLLLLPPYPTLCYCPVGPFSSLRIVTYVSTYRFAPNTFLLSLPVRSGIKTPLAPSFETASSRPH